MNHIYPTFLEETERDRYLDKLIANGYRVKARDIHTSLGSWYTVEDIDKRKGK